MCAEKQMIFITSSELSLSITTVVGQKGRLNMQSGTLEKGKEGVTGKGHEKNGERPVVDEFPTFTYPIFNSRLGGFQYGL
jgi:hypothetical protein